MIRRFALLFALGALPAAGALAAGHTPASPRPAAPRVEFETTLGDFVVALDPARAPATVKNFLEYVRSGFYNGTIFHRVVAGFVVQGGGYTTKYKKKATRAPIPDEADNGLSNTRGTIAMARQMDPNTATSQFYINLGNNTSLNYGGPGRPGYAVFGRVVSGLDVVNRIGAVATGPAGPFSQSAPLKEVVIKKAFLLSP